MLDTLEVLPTAIVPPAESYRPFTHSEAEKTIPPEGTKDSLHHGLETLVSAYETARVAHGVTYEDGISGLIADLAGDIRGSQDARKVLAVAQKYLGKDELRAVVQFFQRTKTLWTDLLDQASLTAKVDRGEISRTPELRLHFASYQQKLAQFLYEVGFYHPDAPEAQVLRTSIAFISELAKTGNSDVLDQARNTFYGALAQAALMRGFQERGYSILVPDPNSEDEMRMTDMRGVDFVTVAPDGKLLLVDTKGRHETGFSTPRVSGSSIRVTTERYVVDCLSSLQNGSTEGHPGLRQAILAAHNDQATDMTGIEVTLPVRSGYLRLGRIAPDYEGPFMHSIINEIEHIGEYETAA